MPKQDYRELVELVETWRDKRVPLAREETGKSLRDFVETMNFHTRQLMSELQKGGTGDDEFWSAFSELSNNAGAMIQRAKIFVDGQDRSNL